MSELTEIFDAERSFLVRERKRLVGFGARMAAIELATPLEFSGRRARAAISRLFLLGSARRHTRSVVPSSLVGPDFCLQAWPDLTLLAILGGELPITSSVRGRARRILDEEP
jgi:hypothetical protein